MNCLNCGKELTGKWQKKFCGSSCAATYNNKKFPKRNRERKYYEHVCPNCGKEFLATGHEHAVKKFCDRQCYRDFLRKQYEEKMRTKTLADVKRLKSFQTGQWAYVHENARLVLSKENLEWSCKACGYDKHVHVCHIKPIKEFDLSATLSEVNSLDNLALLCPNCHWELDHGMLQLE